MGPSSNIKNNILILYLIYKMDLPLPLPQIEIVALEYMDYFALQDSLHGLLDIRYLEAHKENNTTRYIITEEGVQSLDYFENLLPQAIRKKINQYVLDNRKSIKRDYETTADFFKNLNSDDFIVKCALYEDDVMLMEINLSVVSKEQARLICDNWKSNITKLYGSIIENLIDESVKKPISDF